MDRLPLLLIPGIEGSQLWETTSNKLAWLNFRPVTLLKVLHNLELQPDGRTPVNPVNIAVNNDNHGIDGLSNLNPECLNHVLLETEHVMEKLHLKRTEHLTEETAAFFCNATVSYQKMITSLTEAGYVIGQTLFGFPYDWRLDNHSNAELLKDRVQAICEQTGSKIQIVAHSMGGLVLKDFLLNHADLIDSCIDQTVTLGTPYLGAGKGSATLAAGMGTLGNRFDHLISKIMRDLARNTPGVYQLAPSAEYLNLFGTNACTVKLKNGDAVDATTQFPNQALWQDAINLHNEWDHSYPAAKQVHYAAYKSSTIRGFFYNETSFRGLYPTIIYTFTPGDGTVPLLSANHPGSESAAMRYVEEVVTHLELIQNPNVIQDVINVLQGKESGYPSVCPVPEEELLMLNVTSYALAGQLADFEDLTLVLTHTATGNTNTLTFDSSGLVDSTDFPPEQLMIAHIDDYMDVQIVLPDKEQFEVSITGKKSAQLASYQYSSADAGQGKEPVVSEIALSTPYKAVIS